MNVIIGKLAATGAMFAVLAAMALFVTEEWDYPILRAVSFGFLIAYAAFMLVVLLIAIWFC